MRKLLYGAILLASTALYPTHANAMPPVLGFIGGIISALGATGIGGAIVGLGGAGALGGFAAGWGFAVSAIGGALLNAAISIGISALVSLLRPKPTIPTANPGARLVNIRQPVSWFEHAYGVVRKGGPIAFWQAKDGKRFYDVILAARRINGIRQWMADERTTEINENGYALNGDFYSEGRSRLRLFAFLGAVGQVAPAILMDNFSQWTAAHDMEGLAHVVAVAENVKAEDFNQVWPTSREPAIAPIIEGYLCFDPRDPTQSETDPLTHKFTTNAALIIADWIVSRDGLNRRVDWEQVKVEADASDIDILDRNGNPVKKWQLGGAYSSADEREVVRAQMGVASDTFFYEGEDGIVGFHVGRYMEPDVELTDDDILSISYAEGQSGTDITNAFSIEYSEPENGYRENASAPYVIEAPNEPYEEDSLSAYWIPNHNQAVRVAKRLLEVSRAKYRVSIIAKYHAVKLRKKRFFRLRHVEAGVDEVFEIDKLKRADDGISWAVEAHSVKAADFAFNSAVEEPAKPARTGIEVDDAFPAPANIAATVEPYYGSVSIKVTWDAPPRDTILHQVRYRVKFPVGNWTTMSVPVGQNFQNIVGISDHETYEVQVRSMLATGRGSPWQPVPPLTVAILLNPTPPLSLASFNILPGVHLGSVAMRFGTRADPNLSRIQIFRTPSGAAVDTDADVIGPPIGAAPSTTFDWIDGDGTRVNLINDPEFLSAPAWTINGNFALTAGQAVLTAGATSRIYQPLTIQPQVGDVVRYGTNIIANNGSGAMFLLNRTTPSSSGGNTQDLGTAVGVKLGALPITSVQTQIGIASSSTRTATFEYLYAYIQSDTCIAPGLWDYRARGINPSGLPGPMSPPVTVLVI
ncbi:phage tail protein [Oryzicola mucosus]|uniref:Fibronectin type III domain-containing protein n=1 Tax=Oryzicola mucosus TaxID=2767425 RepID=A0A8J6PY43_9HYPH|nr:fibronectin type III domain-containing protein [Oryzicola mucosus]MBD0416498.1 fibronectin type III domain-containing protein [Oryzicola mucosus]